MAWAFPEHRTHIKIHKIDGYFLSISLSILLCAFFRYNWAYMLVTGGSIFVLHKLLYFNFRTYRYVLAGLSSFMWGVCAYFVGAYVTLYLLPLGAGFQIVMLFSMATYAYSMFAHFREFKGWFNEHEVSVEKLVDRLRNNNGVKWTIGITTIFYLATLALMIGIGYFQVNPDQWAMFKKPAVAKRPKNFTQHHQSNHRLTEPIALYYEVDKKNKIGEIRKGTHCDTILNWAKRQPKQYSDYNYSVVIADSISWCRFDPDYTLALSGWFQYDTTDPYFTKVAFDD